MSEDLSYTRAIWKRQNGDGVLIEEEGVVPLCWLEGKDIVRYPPKAKKERALRKKQIPQQDWMYGKLVHRKVTGSLETCENWAYSTCAASSDSDENVVEEDDNEIVPITKTGRDKVEYLEMQSIAASPPPKKRVLCATQQLKQAATFENINDSFPRSPQFPCMSENSLQQNSNIPYSACLNGTPAASTTTAPQRNVVFPIDQGKFQRKVLFKLEQLSEAVKSLNDRLDTRLDRVIDADVFLLKENINNMDDFNENENQLAEEPMKRKLIERLSKIGGTNIGDCTRRIMRRMLDCSLMINFNMDGQRGGKRSFKETHLYKCVIAAVRETYPKESEKTVHKFIQGVLKNAPASRKS